jgi:indole-3-glycerol phosphate synthase
VTGGRRFSQAISEGDGISVIVRIEDGDAARRAEEQGAEGLAVEETRTEIRGSTSLPILMAARTRADAAPEQGDADAVLLTVDRAGDVDRLEQLHAHANELGLECVVGVADEEELELALNRIDPEIFLLSAPEAEDAEEAVDHVLELLPDLPAGKLAIASIGSLTRAQIVTLERAGMDAVLVGAGDVTELVGGSPPEV